MSADTETAGQAGAAPTAPAAPCKQLEDGVNHLMQGKRHLLVKDYPSAVASLAEACQLLAGKYGDLAPECGDPYLCYGKALLELARAEAGVIEMNPPKSDSDDDEEGEGDEDDDSKEDKESQDEKESQDDKESKGDDEEELKDSEEEVKNSEDDSEESKKSEVKKNGQVEKDDAKKNGQEANKNKDVTEEKVEAGTSNGAGPSKSGDGDDADEDNEDDGEVNNLQLAWEILEMAKIIYQKQVDADANSKDAKIRLSEIMLKLGEVGIESENWETAIGDLKSCLAIQKQVLEEDDRRLAETHYQLAVAFSNNHQFQESIESYEKACAQLQVRIDYLEAKRPQEDTIGKVSVDSEIKELKDLLLEMKERLNDTVTEKDEPAPEDDQDEVVKNGTDSKPVSNIAHLVRKKPKTEVEHSKKEAPVDSKTELNVTERKRKSDDERVPLLDKKAKVEAES